MNREMTISVKLNDFFIGAEVSVEVPNYVVALKQTDKRFVHKKREIYVTMLYDYKGDGKKKMLRLSVGKRFEKIRNQVSVAKVLCVGRDVNVYGYLE